MGRSSKAKNPINAEKVKCDGRTDGPTDGRTDGRTDRRTDRPIDGPTDQRTGRPSYRDARTHLKRDENPLFLRLGLRKKKERKEKKRAKTKKEEKSKELEKARGKTRVLYKRGDET